MQLICYLLSYAFPLLATWRKEECESNHIEEFNGVIAQYDNCGKVFYDFCWVRTVYIPGFRRHVHLDSYYTGIHVRNLLSMLWSGKAAVSGNSVGTEANRGRKGVYTSPKIRDALLFATRCRLHPRGTQQDPGIVEVMDQQMRPYTQCVIEWKALREPKYAWGSPRGSGLRQAVFDPDDLFMYAVVFLQGVPSRNVDTTFMASGAGEYVLNLSAPDKTGLYQGLTDPYDAFLPLSGWKKIRLF